MVHAAGLEILDALGLRTAVEDRGVRQTRIDFHTRHEALFTVDFTGLDTAFPYYVNVPQPEVEAVLADRFTATGGGSCAACATPVTSRTNTASPPRPSPTTARTPSPHATSSEPTARAARSAPPWASTSPASPTR